MTTPLTVGVKIRRREARRNVKTNCTSVDATTKLASKLGPPACNAKAHTAKNGTLKFVTISRPAPRYGNLKECRIMLAPVTTSAANITQLKYASKSPDARITSAASMIKPIVFGMNICNAVAAATSGGQFSPGS